MKKDIYAIKDVVETIYDPAIRSIIVTWYDFNQFGILRPCLEAQVECVREDGAKMIIVDTTKAKGIIEQLDQEWLGTHVFPVYEEYGVKAVITILPKSSLTLLSAKQWQMTGSAFGVDFVETSSFNTAMDIVKQYMESSVVKPNLTDEVEIKRETVRHQTPKDTKGD